MVPVLLDTCSICIEIWWRNSKPFPLSQAEDAPGWVLQNSTKKKNPSINNGYPEIHSESLIDCRKSSPSVTDRSAHPPTNRFGLRNDWTD